MTRATHENRNSGKKVIVERYEGNIVVVKNLKGKALKTYNKKDMKSFNERYMSLSVTKGKEDAS